MPSTTRAGRGDAHLYTFPFPLFVDTEDPPAITEIKYSDCRLRFYPPFRSAPANFTPAPRIDGASIPFRYGDRPDRSLDVPHPAVLPLLDLKPNGGTEALILLGPAWPRKLRTFPMDSLRVDAYGAHGESAANAATRALLSKLRWLTRQWWIGRTTLPAAGYLRSTFAVTDHGRFVKMSHAYTGFRKFFADERGITQSTWAAALESTRTHATELLHHDLLMDARAAWYEDDFRRLLLDAATACEMAKDLAYERLWPATGRRGEFRKGRVRELKGWDLHEQIGERLDTYVRRSYQREHLERYNSVERLWKARGDVAHGIEPRFLADATRQERIDQTKKLVLVGESCVEWLDSLSA